MSIYGIGTDIINVLRVGKILRKNKIEFKKKIFTKKEIFYCDSKKNSDSYYAKRFAAKEAFVKALGTGFSKGITLKSIEVLRKDNGYPYLRLFGEAKKKALKGGYESFNLSISDTKEHSLALVVVEGE